MYINDQKRVKQRNIFVAVSSIMFMSAVTHAAMPKSIKYVEDVFADADTIYVHHKVTCKNGESYDISYWDNVKLWCQGKGEKNLCNKKKIKTAKDVCN